MVEKLQQIFNKPNVNKKQIFLKFEIAVAFGKAGTLWLDCVI